MGRKAGGKNFGNFLDEGQSTAAERAIADGAPTPDMKSALPEIFTCITKDFIGVKDLMESSGLSYETCTRIIREIKAISDVFHISGFIHRTDYYLYISRKFINQ